MRWSEKFKWGVALVTWTVLALIIGVKIYEYMTC